jgi:hypothetical protein
MRDLRCGMSLRENAQRYGPVSFRNLRLLVLSVMKRRPEAVVQTCAAADVRYASLLCSWRCRAGSNVVLDLRSVGGTGSEVVGSGLSGGGLARRATP